MTEHLRFIQNNKLLSFLLFLVVFFLPTQLGKHFWPEFSFIAGLRIDYLSPTIYFSDILIIAFIALSLVVFGKKVLPPKQLLFVYLFLAIGIYLSKSPLPGWYYLAKFTEFLFFGFSLKTYVSFFHTQSSLWMPIALSVVFESFLGIWQFLLQSSVGGIFYFFGERTFTSETPGIANASLHGQLVLRPYATFSHPNVFGGFLALSMILLVFFFPYITARWQKGVLYCTLALGTAALFLTLSRTAIVLWIVFLLFLFFRRFSYQKTALLFGAVFTVTLLSIPLLRFRFFDVSLFSESTTQRIMLLQAAWKMVAGRPVFGVGFANFLGQLPVLLRQEQLQTPLYQPVHNIFFLIAAETGCIGLLLSLWFVLKTFQLKILDKNANGRQKQRGFLRLFLFFGILFLGQFDHYLITLQQGQLLLTVVLAVLWGTPSQETKDGTMNL